MLKVELEKENRELKARVLQLQEQIAAFTAAKAAPKAKDGVHKLVQVCTLVGWHLNGRPRPQVVLQPGDAVSIWKHDGLVTVYTVTDDGPFSMTKRSDGTDAVGQLSTVHAALLKRLQ